MEIRLRRGATAVGIDHHQPGATLPRAADQAPGVNAGADRVHAPHENQPRVDEVLRIGPRRSHEPGEPGVLSAADRALETARSQPVKQRMRGAERGQRAHAPEI